MRLLWSEAYLWIHLAGLAALPLCLEVCLLGLATGDPVLPVWLELLLLLLIGIGPILWMQLQRPFYIFSILAVALTPEQLSDNQRRILRLFRHRKAQVWAIVTAIAQAVILIQLYRLAPIAAEVTPFGPGGRLLGLLVAGAAFFASHLFLQVPVSVLQILLYRDAQFLAIEPYPLEQIRSGFTIPGLQVKQILPPLASESPVAPEMPSTVTATTASLPEDSDLDNPWDVD